MVYYVGVAIVAIIAIVAIVVGCAIAYKNRKKQEKLPLKRPIKIPTEDGYLLVDTFVPTDSIISIKQIHEKGKCADVNRKFWMGLSARHSAGCDLNKKTYAQTLYLSSYCPDVLSKLVEAIRELQERGLT